MSGSDPAVALRPDDWEGRFRQCEPDLRATVRGWIADPHAVEDVVQETFAEAYRSRRSYDPSLPLLPWLRTIARQRAMHRWRREQRMRLVPLEAVEELSRLGLNEVGSDEHVALIVRRDTLGEALARLTERQRRVLVRWALDRRSTAELAASEGTTPASVRQLVKRARRDLPDALPAGFLVPLGAQVLDKLRARWAKATASGWTDAAVAWSAVPAVVVGMAVTSIWPVPSPVARPEPHTGATERPPAVVVTTPAAVEPAADIEPASGTRPAAPHDQASTSVPPTASTRSGERVSSKIDIEHPGARTEYIAGFEIYCDTGLVTTVVCKATPD